MPNHSADLLKVVSKLDDAIHDILKSKVNWFEKVGLIVEAIVPEVETIGSGWKGADKKELALNIIEDLWFRHFEIKKFPNFIEKILVKKLASFAIDKFVSLMNKTGVFKKT